MAAMLINVFVKIIFFMENLNYKKVPLFTYFPVLEQYFNCKVLKYSFSTNVESIACLATHFIGNIEINLMINWTIGSESSTYLLHGYLDFAN